MGVFVRDCSVNWFKKWLGSYSYTTRTRGLRLIEINKLYTSFNYYKTRTGGHNEYVHRCIIEPFLYIKEKRFDIWTLTLYLTFNMFSRIFNVTFSVDPRLNAFSSQPAIFGKERYSPDCSDCSLASERSLSEICITCPFLIWLYVQITAVYVYTSFLYEWWLLNKPDGGERLLVHSYSVWRLCNVICVLLLDFMPCFWIYKGEGKLF